jgi:asparaginyl-tRNA synthetase
VEELEIFDRNPEDVRRVKFTRVTYEKAVGLLREDFPGLEFGDDLKAHHEARLTEKLGPVFVTHYPLPIKFFNMRQNFDDSRVVNSVDMLLPFSGESAGAAEREHDYETICRRLRSSAMYRRLIELGGKDEDFAWYLDAHKDREVPLHSGAGIGLARVAQFILGQKDIRQAVPFLLNRENLL